MKYFHRDGVHLFMSDNPNVPHIVVDVRTGEQRVSFTGNTINLSVADILDFSALSVFMISKLNEDLSADEKQEFIDGMKHQNRVSEVLLEYEFKNAPDSDG